MQEHKNNNINNDKKSNKQICTLLEHIVYKMHSRKSRNGTIDIRTSIYFDLVLFFKDTTQHEIICGDVTRKKCIIEYQAMIFSV